MAFMGDTCSGLKTGGQQSASHDAVCSVTTLPYMLNWALICICIDMLSFTEEVHVPLGVPFCLF